MRRSIVRGQMKGSSTLHARPMIASPVNNNAYRKRNRPIGLSCKVGILRHLYRRCAVYNDNGRPTSNSTCGIDGFFSNLKSDSTLEGNVTAVLDEDI